VYGELVLLADESLEVILERRKKQHHNFLVEYTVHS
jgi:hypothetical protein